MKPKAAMVWLLTIFAISMTAFSPVHAYAKTAKAPQVTAASVMAQVNLNKADLEQLESIRGIGPALAERIMSYRSENGKFASVEELTNVRGIGQAKLDRIKTQLIV